MILFILILLGTVLIVYQGFPDVNSAKTTLPSLQIPRFSRLLVIAPHCDDETLGTGGLIQNVLQKRGSVGVVVLTNGDGFSLAARRNIASPKEIRLSPEDFIHLGYLRRSESAAAMRSLNIPAQNVYFLGYPDRGLIRLWSSHWSLRHPYKSLHTQVDRCPYQGSFHPSVLYAGDNLVSDLRRIMTAFKPDIIAYPLSDDEHPDHSAAFAFTKLVLTLTHLPIRQELLYVVHHPQWPQPIGRHPDLELYPPHRLIKTDTRWEILPLSHEFIQNKIRLIGYYHSQIDTTKDFYYTFARRNELFGTVKTMDLPVHVSKRTPITQAAEEKVPDLSGTIANIDAVYTKGALWFTLHIKGNMQPEMKYAIDLTLLDNQNRPERIGCVYAAGEPSLSAYTDFAPDISGIEVRSGRETLSMGLNDRVLSRITSLIIQGSAVSAGRIIGDRTEWKVVRLNRRWFFGLG